MARTSNPEPPKWLAILESKVLGFVQRVPAKAWMVFGLFLLVALFMAIRTAMVAKDSSLRVKIQHSFRTAELSVWVDDDLVYNGKLYGTTKKKLGVVWEQAQGSFSDTFPVSTGGHQVRVRTAADDGTVQEDALRGNFGRENQLTLSAIAHHDQLSLGWQGGAAPAPDSSGSGGSWVVRYAGSLMVTIAGSIASALVGYVLKTVTGRFAPHPQEALAGRSGIETR
ncbi:MAG: hypothetical protein WB952_03540 [Terriglobales bacterium]